MSERSQEWYRLRLGKVTASELVRLRTEAGRLSYAKQLRREFEILKRLEDGEDIVLGPSFTSAATDWGIQTEPLALAEWEYRHDTDLEHPLFVLHPDYDFIGCSPDGLTPDGKGGAEAKCPWDETIHRHTLVAGMPEKHVPQVNGEMWVCLLDWCDFISYDPRAPLTMQYYEQRVHREETSITRLEGDVLRFWEFVLSGKDEPPVTIQAGIPSIF